MEMPNSYREQIDDYLTGRLAEAEQRQFDDQLRTNAELREAVAAQKVVLSGIDDFGNDQLRKRLRKISAARKPKVTPVRRIGWRQIAAVAAVGLLLLMLGWWWQSNAVTVDPFAEHFDVYELSLTSRATGEDPKLAVLEGLYRRQRYDQFLSSATPFLQQNSNNYPLQLAVGISHLQQGQYEAALPSLNVIIAAKDPFLLDQALWYQALAFLKIGKVEQSKELLRSLAKDPSSDRQASAAALLESL